MACLENVRGGEGKTKRFDTWDRNRCSLRGQWGGEGKGAKKRKGWDVNSEWGLSKTVFCKQSQGGGKKRLPWGTAKGGRVGGPNQMTRGRKA